MDSKLTVSVARSTVYILHSRLSSKLSSGAPAHDQWPEQAGSHSTAHSCGTGRTGSRWQPLSCEFSLSHPPMPALEEQWWGRGGGRSKQFLSSSPTWRVALSHSEASAFMGSHAQKDQDKNSAGKAWSVFVSFGGQASGALSPLRDRTV